MKKPAINLIVTDFATHLGKKIARNPQFNVLFPGKNREESRFFPDGEIYVRLALEKLSGRVVILHTGAPKPNEGLVELEIILAIFKQAKINPEIFFSYFPYAMQDKVFLYGETDFTFDLIEKFINFYHAKKIYILDPHFLIPKDLSSVVAISATDLLIKAAKKDFPDIIFLSPDHGEALRTGLPSLKKKRIDSYRVAYEIDPKIKEKIKGKTVAIVDDILETGGTLLKIYDHLKDCGAKKIVAIVTHAVLKEGIQKVRAKFNKLIFTNSIDQSSAACDISGLIAANIVNLRKKG